MVAVRHEEAHTHEGEGVPAERHIRVEEHRSHVAEGVQKEVPHNHEAEGAQMVLHIHAAEGGQTEVLHNVGEGDPEEVPRSSGRGRLSEEVHHIQTCKVQAGVAGRCSLLGEDPAADMKGWIRSQSSVQLSVTGRLRETSSWRWDLRLFPPWRPDHECGPGSTETR